MADETTNTNATTTETTPPIDYKAEFERMQGEYAKLKTSFDEASSKVAEYKRNEKARMSDEERKTAEQAEREAYYKDLERRLALSEYATELADVEDATVRDEIATLYADGKIVEAMKKHKEYREKATAEMEKRIKADLMKQNPTGMPQQGAAKITKDEIMAIKDPVARQNAIAQNINLFT